MFTAYSLLHVLLYIITYVENFNSIFQPCQEPELTISQVQPIDLQPTDTEEVIQLKYKVRRLEVIAENRKRRLNLMWQSRRRLKKKLDRMKCMIKHLIKNRKDNGFDFKVGSENETNR